MVTNHSAPSPALSTYMNATRYARCNLARSEKPNASAAANAMFRYQPLDDRGLKYDVFLSRKGSAAFQRLAPADRPRYLVVPREMPDRVRELAVQWTAGAATTMEKAKAIEGRLRTEYRYDLGSPTGRSKQLLDDFLFESKRGH